MSSRGVTKRNVQSWPTRTAELKQEELQHRPATHAVDPEIETKSKIPNEEETESDEVS